MRIMIIDDYTKKERDKIIKYAEDHIYDKYQLKLIMSGDILPAGDNPNHILHIHDGYRVVFSIEEQPLTKPYNNKLSLLCNHISISINEKGKYPNQEAVLNILELFNMKPSFSDCIEIWLEDKIEAVNLLQINEKFK